MTTTDTITAAKTYARNTSVGPDVSKPTSLMEEAFCAGTKWARHGASPEDPFCCSKPMTTTTHTPGAIRAAASINRALQRSLNDIELDYFAEIIDRETGVGDLLKASKAVLPYIHAGRIEQQLLAAIATATKD